MSDLNDFFAKKDKKKPKGIKFTTANDIDKKLKITDKNRLKSGNDEEWNDFEEKKKDYTGLQILNSRLIEEDDINISEADITNTSSPWKVDALTPEEHDGFIERAEETAETARIPAWGKLPSPKMAAYVPPHLRNRSVLSVNPRDATPRIDKEIMFPMLGSSITKKKVWKNSGLNKIDTIPQHTHNSTQIPSARHLSKRKSTCVGK